MTSGFPFSTRYVASSAPFPLPTFFAEWIVPAGLNSTPRFQRDPRLAVHLVLHRSLKDVDDLFARMRVPAERYSRAEVDAHLDDLASGDAEILLLEIGTFDSRLLRSRRVHAQTGSDDDCCHRNPVRSFHVNLLEYMKPEV